MSKKKAPKSVNPRKDKPLPTDQKSGDAAIAQMGTDMPYGKSKEFQKLDKEHQDIEAKIADLNKQKRGVRARMKEMKVDLGAYDLARKLRKMDDVDRRSFEASVANCKEQMSMELTEYEKVLKEQLTRKKEAVRDAIVDAGGDTGKEIGSSSASQANEDVEGEEDSVSTPSIPQENTSLSANAPVGTIN